MNPDIPQSEIREIVIKDIQEKIMESLFKYNFYPIDCEGDAYDMEIIRLYRGLLTEAFSKDLFDLIDAKIQTKLKNFNK